MAAAGAAHSLALDVSGRVWAWGGNGSGQVGNGQSGASVLVPFQVPLLSGIRAIAAGGNYSLALGEDGRVWAWGENTEGQLGNGGTSAAVLAPALVAGLPVIRSISAGRNHALALGTDGRIWAWGQNTYGQVGTGDTVSPVVSPTLMTNGPVAKAIAAGGGHSLLISAQGTDSHVWAWGRNDYGQVGNGVASASPVLIPISVGNNVFVVTDIAAGDSFSLIIMADPGFVMTWGRNAEGQLGTGDTVDSSIAGNVMVNGNQLAYGKAIAAGANHALVVHLDCEPPSPLDAPKPPVWGWGDNTQGQLATGTTSAAPTTAPVAGLVRIHHRDADEDGFGSDTAYLTSNTCEQPTGYLPEAGDCNDANAAIRPGTSDVCDGLDNNCDGQVDDGQVRQTWYRDEDGDGYGNASASTLDCQQPTGHVENSGDCDDTSANIRPGASEVCDSVDNDCDGASDNDVEGEDAPCLTTLPGVCAAGTRTCTAGSLICEQTVASSDEQCDSLDNDCDGVVDDGVGMTWYLDSDGDGLGNAAVQQSNCSQPSGYVANHADCNDSNASVGNPTTWYRDADGDSLGNAAVQQNSCSQPSGYVDNHTDCNDSSASVGGPATWYYDSDGDGYGNAGDLASACSQPAQFVDNGDDCNDNNASVGGPSAWYRDSDGDGHGNPGNSVNDCSRPSGYVSNAGDCNDSNSSIRPSASEVCDGLDNNCNGSVDEGTGSTWYRDADSDGYGNPGNSVNACSRPSGYVSNADDCNDANSSIRPSASEVCDGVDNNCNGQTDETGSQVFYRDADGDGWGNGQAPTYACSRPSGYVVNASDCNDSNASVGEPTPWYRDSDGDNYVLGDQWQYACSEPSGYSAGGTGGDCNDSNSSINPGATEVCNGYDDNCNGQVDEGGGSGWYYYDGDGDGYGRPDNPTQACSRPSGYVDNGWDCNDWNPAIRPGAVEVCDGYDNDCDGQIDWWYQMCHPQ